MWTKKQQKAVTFSFQAHKGQKREEKDLPYVLHPMAVGIILAKLNSSEEVIIAGLLHDVIEDTDFEKDDIKEKFGKKVANLVDEVSEKDRDLPYAERKQRAAAKLLEVSDQAVMVKAADVLSNITDLTIDLFKRGEVAFDIFNTDKNSKIKQIERVIKILKIRIGSEKIIKKLEERFTEIKRYED